MTTRPRLTHAQIGAWLNADAALKVCRLLGICDRAALVRLRNIETSLFLLAPSHWTPDLFAYERDRVLTA